MKILKLFCVVSQSTLLHPILIEQSQENDYDSDDDVLDEGISTLDRKHSHVRTLSTRRVCWHRNTSISMNEYKISAQVNLFISYSVAIIFPLFLPSTLEYA